MGDLTLYTRTLYPVLTVIAQEVSRSFDRGFQPSPFRCSGSLATPFYIRQSGRFRGGLNWRERERQRERERERQGRKTYYASLLETCTRLRDSAGARTSEISRKYSADALCSFHPSAYVSSTCDDEDIDILEILTQSLSPSLPPSLQFVVRLRNQRYLL